MLLKDKPAYPLNSPDGMESNQGMTLRQYYAGLAMQLYGKLVFRQNNYDVNYERQLQFRIKECAEQSVMIADALIAELEKSNG